MPDEPKNTIQPPEWLNQEFIQNILRKSFKDDSLRVTKCHIKPAVAAGDNYVSQMFRTTLDISGKCKKDNFSLIIKSLPKGDKMEEFVHDCEFFQKEAKMLSEFLPKLYKCLEKAGYNHKYSAEVYYYQGPPKDLIFLQDLCVDGYRIADRQTGIDLPHCVMVLESLAVLHAGSLVLIEKEPEIKNLSKGFWVRENEKVVKKTLEQGVVGLANEIENWGDTPKRYADSLRSLEKDIVEKTFESFERREGTFNVITHGDTWTNNYMFKYENGKPVSLKFVDFQLSGYNSPVTDLLYFIFSSPRHDIKLSHIDFFLETYHKKLVEVCQKLNLSNFNYSLKELKQDFESRLFFGMVTSIMVFPFTITPEDDIMDVNELLDDDAEMDMKLYRTERFQKEIKLILPYLEQKGLI